MNWKKSLALSAAFAFIFVFTNCSHYDEINNDPKESRAGDDESHESGNDCMSCHHKASDEASEYWFTVAGTVYTDNDALAKSGEVQLWSQPDGKGTLIYTLPIDLKGNFYTNKIIDFKGGYFPYVKVNGNDEDMPEKITGNNMNMSCNACHGHNANGLNTEKIEVK